MKKIIIILLTLLTFYACEEQNCDDEMKDARRKYGDPEEIERYDSADYHSVDYWWWSEGYEMTFTWGENVDGCEVSTYSFDPITTSITDKIRNKVESEKQLISEEIIQDCNPVR